jgi:hypothetical protein
MLFFHALFLNSSFRYALKFRFLVAVVLNQLWPDLGKLVIAAMEASSTMISKDPTQALFPSDVLANASVVDWRQPFCSFSTHPMQPASKKCFCTSGCAYKKDRLSNSFFNKEPLHLLSICNSSPKRFCTQNTAIYNSNLKRFAHRTLQFAIRTRNDFSHKTLQSNG